jgi:hypothetical protein
MFEYNVNKMNVLACTVFSVIVTNTRIMRIKILLISKSKPKSGIVFSLGATNSANVFFVFLVFFLFFFFRFFFCFFFWNLKETHKIFSYSFLIIRTISNIMEEAGIG